MFIILLFIECLVIYGAMSVSVAESETEAEAREKLRIERRRTFFNTNQTCLFNYKPTLRRGSPQPETLATLFINDFGSLCCLDQTNASIRAIYLDQFNCCASNTTRDPSRNVFSKYRPCPNSNYLATFGDKFPNVIRIRKNQEVFGRTFVQNKCPSPSLNRLYFIHRLFPLEDGKRFEIPVRSPSPCRLSGHKIHFSFYSFKVRTRRGVDSFIDGKYRYSWCCRKDVFQSYKLDPRKECCGMSGAQSNFYARGARFRPDTPPCCRNSRSYDQYPQSCEPAVVGTTRRCPTIAGLWNQTFGLQNLPNNAPYNYDNNNKCSDGTATYYPRNFYSTFFLKNKTNEETFLCCKVSNRISPNYWAKTARDIMRQCCIDTIAQQTKKSIKIPCSTGLTLIKEYGRDHIRTFVYRACDPSKCINGTLMPSEPKKVMNSSYRYLRKIDYGNPEYLPSILKGPEQ